MIAKPATDRRANGMDRDENNAKGQVSLLVRAYSLGGRIGEPA